MSIASHPGAPTRDLSVFAPVPPISIPLCSRATVSSSPESTAQEANFANGLGHREGLQSTAPATCDAVLIARAHRLAALAHRCDVAADRQAALEDRAADLPAEAEQVPEVARRADRMMRRRDRLSAELALMRPATSSGLTAKAGALAALLAGDRHVRADALVRHAELIGAVVADVVRLGAMAPAGIATTGH